MTVMLYKTQKEAQNHLDDMKKRYGWPKGFEPGVVKLRYDPRDGPQVGMRGHDFEAEPSETYFTIIDDKGDLEEFRGDVYSEVFGIED